MASSHNPDGSDNDDTTAQPAGGKDGRTDQTDRKALTTDDSGRADGRIHRRSVLKLAGAAAAFGLGSAATAGSAAAATKINGITFDRVVNIVKEYGADPTGNEPVDGAVKRAIKDRTLIQFPEGRYRFARKNQAILNKGTVGFIGLGDNVTFVPPSGTQGDDYLFTVGGGNNTVDRFLFKNIDFDIQADDTTTGLKMLVTKRFHVENVEFIGRGDANSYKNGGGSTDCFVVRVTDPDGVGTLKNVVAKKGSHWARYGGGRAPLWSGAGTRGTLRVIDCHFEEFGGSGLYATAIRGKIQVEGGLYRNNNGQAMRFGGEGSYVDGARIEIDGSKYTGARESQYESRSFRHRGIVINQKTAYINKPPGATIRNCDIVINDHPSPGPGVMVRGPGKTVTIENTRIQVNANVPAVLREGQTGFGKHPASKGARWVRMNNVSVTGSANNGSALQLVDAEQSELTNCCIQQTGSGRGGVAFVRSGQSSVTDSTINVTGTDVATPQSNVQTNGISTGGSCPVPSGNSGKPMPDGGTEQPEATEEPEPSEQPEETEEPQATDEPKQPETQSLPRTLTVRGTGTQTNYEIAVSGELKADPGPSDVENWDEITGSTVTGWVTNEGDVDSYRFSGEVSNVTFREGNAAVAVDGNKVDAGAR
jgi:hypothetical protein